MTPERYHQVNQLFHEALDRAGEDRADFLKVACGGDESLRLAVERMLVAREEAGSFLNAPRLKGIHTAVKSGMLAAETIAEALAAGRADAEMLSGYVRRYRESWLWTELRRVRNMRQAFAKDFFLGMAHAGLLYLAGGRLFRDPLPVEGDAARMRKLAAGPAPGAPAVRLGD